MICHQQTDLSSFINPELLEFQPEPNRAIKLSSAEEDQSKHTFICRCEMCQQYEGKKLLKVLKFNQEKLSRKVEEKVKLGKIPSEFYFEVLKRLVIPHNKICRRGIDLYIPEICFFEDGECRGMFSMREINDHHIKRYPKSSVTGNLIAKVFNEKRREYKEELKKQIRKIKLKQKMSVDSHRYDKDCPESPSRLSNQKDSKEGQMSVSASSNFLKNSNERNKGKIFKNDLNKNASTASMMTFEEKGLIVVKYCSGLEEIMTENQFVALTMRRKLDPIWKSIEQIKNIIHVQTEKSEASYLFLIRYQAPNSPSNLQGAQSNGVQAKTVKYPNLLKRAETLMKIYNGNVVKGDKDYISDEEQHRFMEALNHSNKQILAEYCVYKIVAFAERFHDEKYTKLTCRILINELGWSFLEDVLSLHREKLTKYTWTEQTYKKKLQQTEKQKYLERPIKVDEQVNQNAGAIHDEMESDYISMKRKYGLSLEVKEDNFELENDEFFKKIHPQFSESVTDVIKKQNVKSFREKYLKQTKKQKKPIVKGFQTHLISMLHLTTPLLKVSSRQKSNPNGIHSKTLKNPKIQSSTTMIVKQTSAHSNNYVRPSTCLSHSRVSKSNSNRRQRNYSKAESRDSRSTTAYHSSRIESNKAQGPANSHQTKSYRQKSTYINLSDCLAMKN